MYTSYPSTVSLAPSKTFESIRNALQITVQLIMPNPNEEGGWFHKIVTYDCNHLGEATLTYDDFFKRSPDGTVRRFQTEVFEAHKKAEIDKGLPHDNPKLLKTKIGKDLHKTLAEALKTRYSEGWQIRAIRTSICTVSILHDPSMPGHTTFDGEEAKKPEPVPAC